MFLSKNRLGRKYFCRFWQFWARRKCRKNVEGDPLLGRVLGGQIQAKNICNSALSTQVIILIIFYLDVVGYLWLNFIGSFLTVLLAYILQKVAKE